MPRGWVVQGANHFNGDVFVKGGRTQATLDFYPNRHRAGSQEGHGEPQVSQHRTWAVCVLGEDIEPELEGGVPRSLY